MTFLHGETVVRVRPAGRDRFGNPAGEPSRRDIPGCGVAFTGSSETTSGGRLSVTTNATLYAPYGTDLVASDRVEVRGVLYEVAGDPSPWANPLSGVEHGLEVRLVVVEEGAA